MKLSNFSPVGATNVGRFQEMYFAQVDVTKVTGHLWWKRTTVEKRLIARNSSGFWYFVDTGEFCPLRQAEDLERSHKANQILLEIELKKQQKVAAAGL